MLSLSRTLLPRLLPGSIQVSSHRTRIYQVPGEEFVRVIPPDPGDPNLQVGPWPRTKEERERAAKKYNLIPEDYEPYPETDGFGDYPNLKAIGAYNRDWYDDFDDTTDHRFFNETLHLDYDLYLWERIDPLESEKGHWSYKKKFFIFACISASVPTLVYLKNRYKIHINTDFKARPLPCVRMRQGYDLYEFPTVN